MSIVLVFNEEKVSTRASKEKQRRHMISVLLIIQQDNDWLKHRSLKC